MPDGLKIVSATLLETFVSIEGGVTRGTSEAQLRPHLHVFHVVVTLAEAEIDKVQVMNLVFDSCLARASKIRDSQIQPSLYIPDWK